MAEPWRQSRLFEDNFDSAVADGWDSATCTITTDANYVLEGDGAASFAAGQYAYKYLNAMPVMWFRWYWYVPTIVRLEQIAAIYSVTDGTLTSAITIFARLATNDLYFSPNGLTKVTAAKPANYQCVEIKLDCTNSEWEIYLDGILAGEGTWTPPTNPDGFYLTFGYGEDLYTPFYLDALAVDRRRIGLLAPASNSNALLFEHDIEIEGVGFNFAEGAAPLLEAESSFNPRLGVGAAKYSDLSGFQHYVIPSQHNGFGQPEAVDENMFLWGMNIDTTTEGMIRLANKVTDYSLDRTPPSSAYLANGFICSASNDTLDLFGLAFGNEAPSASYECLYGFDGTTSLSDSFTCTYGIQDILDNGTYVFLTLGGGNVKKSTKSGGLTFSEGVGGDSVTFDDGTGTDSVTFTEYYTWTNAGSAVIVPTDMGQMAVYDEFVWVAERDTPWVHRAAQIDLSDLEGGNEDDDATYDSAATRVGPGRIPITAMCPYLDYLYIGREDGLYRLNVDGDDIYVKLVETVTRHRDNYRGMCVYNGFLVYQENGQVYQFNGTNKQDITPGPISDTYPYERIQRWAGFAPHGKYLVAMGSPDPISTAKPRWYILYNVQGPWHVLGQLHEGGLTRVNSLPMPLVSLAEDGLNYMRVCSIADSDGMAHIHSQDMRHGASGAGATATSGYITSSTMDFGLPQIYRHLSLIREDVENIVPGTNRVRTTAFYDNSATEHELGVIAADDCTFIEFPADTAARKLRLKHTLETSDENNTPVLRRTIIRYMDRPETVWGAQYLLSLTGAARTYAGESTSYSAIETARLLQEWRDNVAPITLRDHLGKTMECYITDLEIRLGDGIGAERSGTATLAVLQVEDSAYTPPPSGLSYSVT